ncbi:YopX family protein [Roseburia intestinalis]|uniref:YopX protein domain-containing protein n=1 Tax=Roseburia intestinalis TaxID=166486 RepID=A0A3R6DZN9_9FIRM|nr:YopX family protein [Roseburia intestinalis]RHC16756.1 hypothetical protein DW856_10630 [Roseburia intestinalis]
MEDRYLCKAKRTDNDEWVIGGLVRYGFTGREKYYIVPSYASDLYALEIDPSTICWCTGLKDKNGKLIWENDVCDRKEEYPEIVKYNKGDWTLDYSYSKDRESGYCYCNLGFYVLERKCVEVIGNVFDNPELLEV